MIEMSSLRAIAAIFIGILIALCVLFFSLWRGEVSDFASYRSDVKAAGEVQEAATAKTIKDQNQITEDTTNGWKAALDHLHSYYAGRERLRNQPSSGTVPAISESSARVDGACQDAIPAAGELEESCAETTLKLNSLQQWVSSQQKVSE